MKLFVVGDYRGAYRNEYAFRAFSNNNYTVKGIHNQSIDNKVVRYLRKSILIFDIIRADLVYVCACKHNSFLAKIAFLLHKKVITDFYLSFYDTDVLDRRKYMEESRISMKLKNIDITAMTKSRSVLFLNRAEAEYYTNLLQVDRNKINSKIIPLCIPEKKEAELPYFSGKTDVIRFCWCGTFIPLQGLEKIIEATHIAIQNGLKMNLTIWGDSKEKAKPYIHMAKDLGILESIDFINSWNNLDEWQEYISKNCDVTLGIFGDSEKAKTVLANKVVDGVAYRTPVLTGESRGVKEFFGDELFVIENSPSSIAKKMIEISSMSFYDIKNHVDRAYKIYLSCFTPKVYENSLIRAIEEER